jgi:flavin-binding protein dodecin
MVEKTIELTGTSANSIEDAVNLAVARASVTIEGIRRVAITSVSATVEDGSVASWHVQMKLTFTIQDRLHE